MNPCNYCERKTPYCRLECTEYIDSIRTRERMSDVIGYRHDKKTIRYTKMLKKQMKDAEGKR